MALRAGMCAADKAGNNFPIHWLKEADGKYGKDNHQ